jgi:hypothetical protein
MIRREDLFDEETKAYETGGGEAELRESFVRGQRGDIGSPHG